MKKPIVKTVANFPFVDKRELQTHLRLTDLMLANLRKKLPSPLYFIKPDRKVLYNLKLIQHYFLVGIGADHDRLVQEYLATLPQVS